jgi:hypothetical protein
MARPPSVTVAGEDLELERLRHRIDELAQGLLGARDAALGAEAELGVARARITELDHQLHVCTAELKELRRVVASAPSSGRSSLFDPAGGLSRAVRRLARAARGVRTGGAVGR